MVGAATFIQSLTAKVDYLASQVPAAEAAWNSYAAAVRTYERTAGARPWSMRQTLLGWAGLAVPPLTLARAGGWAAFDVSWTRQHSNTFASLRTGIRGYAALVAQQGSVQGPDLVQMTEIGRLRQRGDALRDRGIAVNQLWVRSGAGLADTQVQSEPDAVLRTLAAATPLAWFAPNLPSVTTPGSGSATGAALDTPAAATQPSGMPPWVPPVVGGILVVGVGIALWQYSKTH